MMKRKERIKKMFESDREGYADYSKYIFISAYIFFNRDGKAYYAQYANMDSEEKVVESVSTEKAQKLIWEIVIQ